MTSAVVRESGRPVDRGAGTAVTQRFKQDGGEGPEGGGVVQLGDRHHSVQLQ